MKASPSLFLLGAFWFLLAGVPFAIGAGTAMLRSTPGWIVFGVVAVFFGSFAWLSEGMRRATSSYGVDSYWGLLPFIILIAGRLIGTLIFNQTVR